MGILDELKREAEEARKAREEAETRQNDRGLNREAQASECMLKIHRYLLELVEHLKQVDWEILTSYRLPIIGQVDKLRQGNYLILIDHVLHPRKITLRFDCSLQDERKFRVTPRQAADEFCQFLFEQQVRFLDWPLRDEQHEITGLMVQAKLRIMVSFLFEVDEENACIRLTTHNFEGVEQRRFKIPFQQVDEQWLDGLGRFLLRKAGHRMDSLDIPDELRQRLRQRLEAERSQRLGGSDRPAQTGEDIAGSGLLQRLRKSLVKPVMGG